MAEHKQHNIQETSMEAYIDIIKELSERHQIVYTALFALCQIQGDATDYEMAKFLDKQDPNYVRPRRFELQKLKVIELSQKRKCSVTGKNAMAWKINLAKKRFIIPRVLPNKNPGCSLGIVRHESLDIQGSNVRGLKYGKELS